MEIVRLTQESHQQQTTIDNQQALLRNYSSQMTQLRRCASTSVAFTAVLSKQVSVSSGQPVVWDKVLLNLGGAYNASNGAFTCAVGGVYALSIHVVGLSFEQACITLQHNTNRITSAWAYNDHNNYFSAASTDAVVQLIPGDVVRAVTCGSTRVYQDAAAYQVNSFSGHMVTNAACKP